MDKQKILEAAVVRKDIVMLGTQPVTIRELMTLEFSEYGDIAKTDKVKANAKLICSCVIDEEGKAVFTEEEALGLARIVRTAIPLVTAIMQLSGISGNEEEAEKHSLAS